MSTTTQPQPLDGLRVLDLATLFAGPLAATLLGDFGAEVIKVEHPAKPDPSRGHGPAKQGVGLWWKLLGRNKRAITLDLSKPGGRDTLLVGLIWFALGNILCGAATDVPTLAVAKLVEGIGKGMVIVICRSLLYRQFDRMVIVAIGFCTMLLVQGSFASSSVLFAALTQEYGWSRATISLPFSVPRSASTG